MPRAGVCVQPDRVSWLVAVSRSAMSKRVGHAASSGGSATVVVVVAGEWVSRVSSTWRRVDVRRIAPAQGRSAGRCNVLRRALWLSWLAT